MKEANEMITGMSYYIGHLYALMDILSRGQNSFVQQQLYNNLRTLDPKTLALKFGAMQENSKDAMQENSKDYLLQVRDPLLQEYQRSRDILLKAIEKETDSEEKKYLEDLLQEFDGPFNLLSTLDANSSPEYTDSIKKTIDHSMAKLFEKMQGREKGYDGM